MALPLGTRLGPYEVTAQIGVGGMGEVYRATDTNLGRQVAVKVLPQAFAHDADRLARFEREAKTLASLNHTNIAQIYGLERSHGTTALVMELVGGPTLADRIAQGPIPLDEALPIARQIAEALEAAHEHGIIHRDLKPSNIKVRDDGTVKVLDFGLAKAFDVAPSASDASQSPTVTSPAATRTGVIMGTAAYMSPEQARGKPVDKRADIWAFGCVLYEMLAGRRAFPGDDVSDTLAAILRGDPDWNALPASTPAAVRKLLRRCLAKERKDRLPDIAVARLDIVDVLTSPDAPLDAAPAPRPPLRLWQRPTGAAIIAATIAVTVGLAIWALMRPSPAAPVRLTVTPPAGETAGLSPQVEPTGGDVAISPDGRRIVFATHRAGAVDSPQLYVRALDQLEAQPLHGLGDNPRNLFMSPDGNWVGFFAEPDVLRKVPVAGSPALTICGITGGPRGASWGDADEIVFATNDVTTGLLRVSAGGGTAEVLTKPDAQKGELDHYWPELLPGGDAVLFTVVPLTGGVADAQIAVLDMETGQQKVLIRGGSHPRYVATGHIVYGAAGTLRAVAFDLGRLEVRGSDPVHVLQGVVTKPSSGAASFSVAQNGSLVYLAGDVWGSVAARTLVWVDRLGREESIKAPPRAYSEARISPDGTRVAVTAVDQQQDIWIWDLRRQTLTRFTFDPALEAHPLWTPDGRRVVFSSARAGALNLFWQAADGTGPVERLAESANGQFPTSFSPDGTRLVFMEDSTSTSFDIGILPLEGDRRVAPLLKTSFPEALAEVSPDGRWLAYQSGESGQVEVYVRPFPAVDGGKWQVSTGGGEQPLWARNGRELFYLAEPGRVMVAPLQPGATFAVDRPQVVFEGPYVQRTVASYLVSAPVSSSIGRVYDVSADGQRFLMIKEGETDQTAAAREIVVVQNWDQELKRLVPR